MAEEIGEVKPDQDLSAQQINMEASIGGSEAAIDIKQLCETSAAPPKTTESRYSIKQYTALNGGKGKKNTESLESVGY